MKKFIFILALFVFSISGCLIAEAKAIYHVGVPVYPDVDFNHKYAEAIYRATGMIFSGYPDGTFKPDKTINRAEMLKILVENEYRGHDKEYYVDKKCFPDIIPNEWYTKYVCFAKDKGQIHGYPDGTFRPEDEVNLVEALKMYSSIQIYGHDLEASDPWYKSYVDATSSFIPHDFTSFDQSVTRGQMAQLLLRSSTDLGYMDIGLSFLWKTFVTYYTLENHIDVEAIAKGTDHIKNAPYQQYENYDDYGYVAVLYSNDAKLLTEEDAGSECYAGYYEGYFKFAIVDTVDGEIHYLKSEVDLGKLKVPEDALYRFDTDKEPGMLVERYSSCTDSLFTIHFPRNNYYTSPVQVGSKDTDNGWFYADSSEDIAYSSPENPYVDDGEISVIHNNVPTVYTAVIHLPTTNTSFMEPSDVENLEAIAGDSSVSLTWSAASDDVGVTGYQIHYGTNPVAESESTYDYFVDVGDMLEYTLSSLENGITYYFSVIAYDTDGNESLFWSIEASATPFKN